MFMINISKLKYIEDKNFLKYNNQKYELGMSEDDDKPVRPISPFSSLLNLILSQDDFVKKQNDIIRFVNTYTRDPIESGFGPLGERENEHWFYCRKTNIPIIPLFV